MLRYDDFLLDGNKCAYRRADWAKPRRFSEMEA